MQYRCPGCNGRKNVIGLGGMMHKCPQCNATGLTEEVKPETVQVAEEPKRRGRPPMDKNDYQSQS